MASIIKEFHSAVYMLYRHINSRFHVVVFRYANRKTLPSPMTEKYIRTTSLRSPSQKYVSHICIFAHSYLLGFGWTSKYVPNLLHTRHYSYLRCKCELLKFRYSEKATKMWKNLVAFSEYLNFIETTRYRRIIQYKHITQWGQIALFEFALSSLSNIEYLRELISAKGQLISKCPFGVIVWTKIPTKKFDKFLP